MTPENGDDTPHPIMVALDADDPGPFLTIKTVCSKCRTTVTSRQVDARLVKLRGKADMGGALDARAWLAHVERGCVRR